MTARTEENKVYFSNRHLINVTPPFCGDSVTVSFLL